jgi:hypothetical protein
LPSGVVSCNAGGSSFFGYAQGDLFLDKVFLLQVFLFKTILVEIGLVSLFFWLIVGLYIAVLLHPVPRVVPLGFSLHPSFYSSILAPQYESVGG